MGDWLSPVKSDFYDKGNAVNDLPKTRKAKSLNVRGIEVVSKEPSVVNMLLVTRYTRITITMYDIKTVLIYQ